MFLWRTVENYPLIITKTLAPNHLALCLCLFDLLFYGPVNHCRFKSYLDHKWESQVLLVDDHVVLLEIFCFKPTYLISKAQNVWNNLEGQ